MVWHTRMCVAAVVGMVWSVLSATCVRGDDGAATQGEIFRRGVVAADHPLASEAGAEMLRRGGNVVDAAVATSFALSVVRPESCGLGGGGFMVIWNAETRSAIALDYRERAPRRASAEMFLPTDGAEPDPLNNSRVGGLAAGIPGNVAGLCHALRHYGTLDLPTVLGPAIRLAEEGIAVDATGAGNQQETLADLAALPDGANRFASLRELYLNGGRPRKRGERFDSPLEKVLRRIAEAGPAGFYGGEVGEALLREVQRQGGIWSAEDLDPSRLVVERAPLRREFRGSEIVTMPPPSSGGIALLEMLQILSAYEGELDEGERQVEHNSTAYLHRLTEASKHAFADRATYLGDADFVTVPIDRLTSAAYARRLAAKIDPRLTRPSIEYGRSMLPDDGGTSHLSVMDAAGNAVACTETINTGYGSFVVEPTFGIILNNEMDDFTARPGEPNAFGLMQSELNAVAHGKKPLSSMTPTIVVRDGRAQLAVGGSGGPKIISGTTQVLLNMTRFGMSPVSAVSAPRMHHQWQPDVLQLEGSLANEQSDALKQRGHAVSRVGGVGVIQAVSRSPDGLRAASDPRKGGRPAGW